MTAQGFLFATETGMIHRIGTRASIMELTLLRSLAGLVLVTILARNWRVVRTKQLPLQLTRGLVSVSYFWVMMYSFGRLPFADATAISYTQVAYIAGFSALILNERVIAQRWTAACIGILGGVLIVKPAFGVWNAAYLVALMGTSLNGLAFVLNKYLQRAGGDSDLTTMFYANAVAVVCNLPALAMTSLPTPEVWPWLSGVLVAGPIGTYLGIVAVRHANASTLGPYTLLRLPIALAGGVMVFHETPDTISFLGAAIILASCLLAVAPTPRRTQRRVMRYFSS
jgi:drug/metabolite transporter (DMT)-like permease